MIGIEFDPVAALLLLVFALKYEKVSVEGELDAAAMKALKASQYASPP